MLHIKDLFRVFSLIARSAMNYCSHFCRRRPRSNSRYRHTASKLSRSLYLDNNLITESFHTLAFIPSFRTPGSMRKNGTKRKNLVPLYL